MTQFKRKPQPFLKRVFGSPSNQVIFILLVMILAGTQLYINRQASRFEKMEKSKNIQIAQSVSQSSEEPPSSAAATLSTTPTSTHSTNSALSNSSPTTQEPSASANSNDSAANPGQSQNSPTIIIYFAEVAMNILDSQFKESEKTEVFMHSVDYNAGLLPGLTKIFSNPNSQIKILHKEEFKFDTNLPIQFFYGPKSKEIGLSIAIVKTPSLLTSSNSLGSPADGQSINANLEVERLWRDSFLMPQKAKFPASFEISKDAGFFISGILPHNNERELREELSKEKVFSLLNSRDFIQGKSEFVIYIDSK